MLNQLFANAKGVFYRSPGQRPGFWCVSIAKPCKGDRILKPDAPANRIAHFSIAEWKRHLETAGVAFMKSKWHAFLVEVIRRKPRGWGADEEH